MKRSVPLWSLLAVGIVALLIGTGLGASGHGNEAALKAAKSRLATSESERKDLQSQNVDLQSTVDADQEKEADLQQRSKDLDARSSALDQREAAIKGQEDTIAAGTIPGDGTFLVGTDVQPGTYKSTDNSGCYWERDRKGDGSLGDIIANDIVNGQGIVTIAPTDKVFKSTRCSEWHKV